MGMWMEVPKCSHCSKIINSSRSAQSLNVFSEDRVCPACGERQTWIPVVARWVSTAKFINPLSWWSGFWEEK